MTRLKRIAGWVFRLYLVVLLAGIGVLGMAWYTDAVADTSRILGTLWYGIAGFGTVTSLVLIAVRMHSKDPAEPLF